MEEALYGCKRIDSFAIEKNMGAERVYSLLIYILQYTSSEYPIYTLPPSQIPSIRQLLYLCGEWGWHLCETGPRNRVSEIHSCADVVIDLQISRDERESRHKGSRSPGRCVGLRFIDGVLPGEDKGFAKFLLFFWRQFLLLRLAFFFLGFFGGRIRGVIPDSFEFGNERSELGIEFFLAPAVDRFHGVFDLSHESTDLDLAFRTYSAAFVVQDGFCLVLEGFEIKLALLADFIYAQLAPS